MNSQSISIACYDHVPQFVEAALDQLYGNIGSSMAQFRTYGERFDDVHVYAARDGDRLVALFLFRVRQGRAQVLNEVIRVDQEEMQRFAGHVFAHFRNVSMLAFRAVETDVRRLDFPHQRFNYLEDIAMALPPTPQDYLASLGKNTRRNIKRYTDRLMRSFPSCEFEVLEGDAVDPAVIEDIIGFNRARMADKRKASVIDEEETRRIASLAKACGLVGVMRINGRIRAGAISYRAGANYFLNVLAHDPQYDDYWIGILCCYRTICECILRGGREFHFLWGRYDYKFTLGAVQRDLDEVVIYRSPAHCMLHAGTALHTAWHGYARRLKLWLKYGGGRVPRLAKAAVRRIDHLKARLAGSVPRVAPPVLPHTPAEEK